MKYTLKQVMAFTAITYQSEIERINGRNGYLIASNGQRVDQMKPKSLSFAPAVLGFGGGVFIFSANGVLLADNGLNSQSILAVVAAITLSVISVVLFRQHLKLFSKYEKNAKDYALGHEPEGLWDFEYTREAGQKRNLIKSILGARMLVRKMISSTSIPMSNEAVDVRVTHLVKEITKSKEGEVHEALIEEAEFFCKQSVTQMNFYAPLVTFQDSIEQELREKQRNAL